MNMQQKFCRVCGTKLIDKESKFEGTVPYCTNCGEFRFELFNTAVIMIVVNKDTNKILLLKQYGRPFYVLVAGYVNKGESAENAVIREIKEETGMTVSEYYFNRSEYFEPSGTLMLNYVAYVENDSELKTNAEVDSFAWFSFDEARENIKDKSLAQKFLNEFLNAFTDKKDNIRSFIL